MFRTRVRNADVSYAFFAVADLILVWIKVQFGEDYLTIGEVYASYCAR